ncbi:MAG: hypothetical protein C1O27_000257 [Chloroflexi bacterium]|nr:MAG: hypothetical protein C1O27_000257 [Chloroflexota bacterium]
MHAALVALAVAFLALFALPGALSANGSGGVVLQEDIGEYRVELLGTPTRPSVGLWHLSVSVLDLNDGRPVTSYQTHMSATPPIDPDSGDQTPRTYEGVPCTFTAGCQDINVEFDRPGEWEMALTISGPLGEETTQFQARVTEAKIDIGGYTLNGLLLILLGLFAITTRMWWLPWIRRLTGRRPSRRQR